MGGKATLNAPLLDWVFKSNPEAATICHYHDYETGYPTLPWAPPGTVRDTQRDVKGSFNIDDHGCIIVYDKDGKLL